MLASPMCLQIDPRPHFSNLAFTSNRVDIFISSCPTCVLPLSGFQIGVEPVTPGVSPTLSCISPTFLASERRWESKGSVEACKAEFPKLQKELPFPGPRGSLDPSLELGL